MRCPTLKDLPPPPPGKHGWPWTEESPQLPDAMPNGSPWPRISIITPSFNQGQFIEETLRSIILQGYPDVEYIIIDGGSDDKSVDIIKKYEKWIAYWISEPDRGQSHAVNKGLSKATGEIASWLNSDDYYLPGTLETVAEFFFKYPKAGAWAGGGRQINARDGQKLWDRLPPPLTFVGILHWTDYCLPQPACFLNRGILGDLLFLNESYSMQMDYDLWLRISKNHPMIPIDSILSVSHRHPDAKTARRELLYRSLAEKWTILLSHTDIDFTAKDIERYLRAEIEIVDKLREISNWRLLKCVKPLVKVIMDRMKS